MKGTSIKALAGAALLACAAGAAQAASAPLDRAALLKLGDDYLAALVAHDAGKVPLAANVKIVEQAKRIKGGEGLWKTASGAPNPDFKVIVPDAVSQQVGGIVMMQADGKPAQVGFRLKVVDGRIVEAEHMIAVPRETSMANLTKLRPSILMEVPYEYADSRGRMIHIAKSYYDALDLNNGHLAPFAPDCERRENGMRTAPNGGPVGAAIVVPGQPPRPAALVGMQDCTSQLDSQSMSYITTIDNRRVEIADEKTGLALGFSQFRHEMKTKQYPILNDPARTSSTMNFDPFDLPALHIYKIWGGQIHEIEAMGFMAPFNAPSGWE
ncbi:MAG: hypothetical protein ABW278_06925 [Steroidobacteraceae bacterium]